MLFLRASVVLLLLAVPWWTATAANAATAGEASSSLDASLQDYSFEQYIVDFSKTYATEQEYHRRKQIWQANRDKVIRHNSRHDDSSSSSYTLELNMFADLLEEELPTGYDKSFHSAWTTEQQETLSFKQQHHTKIHPTFDVSIVQALPESIDWRIHGTTVTTPVKNQGGCGSCWAFAATAALESHIAIQTGKLFSFSMQELVSCAPNPNQCGGQGACTGSTAELAYDFVARHGIVEEWRFGYQSFTGKNISCTIMEDNGDNNAPNFMLRRGKGDGGGVETANDKDNDDEMIRGAVASIVGFSSIPSNRYRSLLAAVATMGPVVVNVAASGWGLYQGGIYDDSKETTRDINHAVVLEGYGTDKETGEEYWLIRNSWGPIWGENGYIRLKRVDPTTLDDPDSDCKMDVTPGDGIACKKDDDGNDIVPPNVTVCGTSGILFDGVVPIGGHLLL